MYPVSDFSQAQALPGRAFPNLTLRATTGELLTGNALSADRFVLFVYPRTGRPDRAESPDWELLPGAKGCTAEACEFRDLAAGYAAAGYKIYGLSSQETGDQAEASVRLHLPYPLLSDPDFTLASALQLPTFDFQGDRLYVRSTLVVEHGTITRAELGITDAAAHPHRILAALRSDQS